MATKWQMETKDVVVSSGNQCVTPYGRAVFVELAEAKPYKNSPPKFSIVVAFDENVDLGPMKQMAKEACQEKWGGKIPKGLKSAFHDPDESDVAELAKSAQWMRFSAKEDKRPALLGPDKAEIFDPSEIYPGCWVRVVCSCYAYDNVGKGFSFGLRAVQKLADGKPIERGTHAADLLGIVSSDGVAPRSAPATTARSYDDEADGADLFD